MKNNVILVGAYHEMIELCEECGFVIKGIIDNELSGFYYGYPILGKDSDASLIYPEYIDCSLVITPSLPKVRSKLVDIYSNIGFKFATVISPEAKISKYASIGEGTVVQSGVNVAAATKIGRFAKLNTQCNIMHDNKIGDFVTVSPNSVTLGYVEIEDYAYIGANATILPYKKIGTGALIGAAAVVTKDVAAGKIVKGNPAK